MVLKVPTWDDYFMSMAYLVASRSKDESTHIGAVIVGPDREIRATGYNGFVRGIRDDVPERQVRPEKYFWMEHAERNAIFNAGLAGVPVRGCKMYTQGVPCMDCARAIVQSGINKVYIDENWDKDNSEKWAENARRTSLMFQEAGVRLIPFSPKLILPTRFKNGTPSPLELK